MTKSLITSLLITALTIVGLVIVLRLPAGAPAAETTTISDETMTTPEDMAFTFACAENKSIVATFHLPNDESVGLVLSDGRTMELPHTISASGARYANADETIVFWNKGITGFMTEGETTTYSDCVIQEL